MTLLEERLGLDDYIPALREGFQVEEKPSLEFRIASNALKSLLKDQGVLKKVLELLAHDIHFLREQSGNLFNNEVVLWREPEGCFSLRMAIWTKGSDVFIHDHNALGVTGCWFGKILVENWEIKEWLSEEKAKLELKEKIVLDRQYTVYVRPHDQGLHLVDLAEGDFAVSLSAYARPKPRGYIRRFDPVTGAVSKIYHPVRQQRSWARQLLEIMEKS
jgi:hypothetical protein